MEKIVKAVHTLGEQADDLQRKKILIALRDLSTYIETPQDTMPRISHAHLEPILIRIGHKLRIFQLVTEAKQPLTVDELAQKTDTNPSLLSATNFHFTKSRILRYLASVGALKETAKETYSASKITLSLNEPGFESAIYHNVETIAPGFWAFSEYLEENKYQEICDPTNTPFQKAWKLGGQNPFAWLHPSKKSSPTSIASWRPNTKACASGWTGTNLLLSQHHAHDYPDEKAMEILQNTTSAMGPDSVILIDDMVIPNMGAHWHATQVDMVMMVSLASRERTVDQWNALVAKAGLQIKRLFYVHGQSGRQYT
ncbi:hypothetical protein UA08_01132 [Talaromyces atroroseus]|uniref:O-methyltransferase C-terminal domain-containing protein n=1 Tax=Talaromyces atroroseus TaxID=1441469 RepID=A0A1Q5Q9X8_TALAT|nr:hypothetical protein UA08_01132 [Talaromyces atroroseus]OKL62736.1 hypothetical protein UA08_01132 [Talaromyces atroroseus]